MAAIGHSTKCKVLAALFLGKIKNLEVLRANRQGGNETVQKYKSNFGLNKCTT
jgi:hypothetical protein